MRFPRQASESSSSLDFPSSLSAGGLQVSIPSSGFPTPSASPATDLSIALPVGTASVATGGNSLSAITSIIVSRAAAFSSPARAVQSASQADSFSSDSAGPSSDASASGAGSTSRSTSASSTSASAISDSVSSQASSASQPESSTPSSTPPSSSEPPSASSASPTSFSSSTPIASTTSATLTSPFQSLAASVDNTLTTSPTSFTTIVTSVDGHVTTISSALPTSLSTAPSSIASAERTRIIAGATAAGVGVILLLLGALFVYKRHKGRKREFSEAVGRFRREAHGAGGVGLLDDEGFDDDSVPMRRYHDNVVSHTHSGSASTSQLSLSASSPAPSLFRQRAETGSAFREEVYPPPQQFVDPLVGLGAGFGNIVEDVLGPGAPPPSRAPPGSTAPLPPASNANAPPISSANTTSTSDVGGPSPSTLPAYAEPHADGPTYADPFRDLSRSTSPRDPSLYYHRQGSSSSSGTSPAAPQSLLGLPAGTGTAPKKSSPLVNTSASNWLMRSPKKRAHGLSEN